MTNLTATNAAFSPSGTSGQLYAEGYPVGQDASITALYRKNDWDGDNLSFSYPRQNYFYDSDDVSTSNWTRSYVSATSVANGGKISETNVNNVHQFSQTYASAYGYRVISGEFCKAERDIVYGWIQATSNCLVYFNLTTGAVGTSSGGSFVSASIVDLGGGWYRCTIVGLRTTLGSSGFGASTTDNVTSYQGVTGSGLYYRHLQNEINTITRSDYMVSTGSYGTGDPIVTPSKALLKTTSRTQMLVHSDFAGSGATPTGWTNGAMTTARSLVASSYGNGDGAQAVHFDNTSAQASNYFYQGVSLASNTTYCVSTIIETVNVTAGNNRARSFLAAQSGPSGYTTFYPPCPANPTGGASGAVQPGILLMWITTASTAGNANLRTAFGGSDLLQGTCKMSRPQCEVGTSRTAFLCSGAATLTVTDYSYTDSGAVTLGQTESGAYTWSGVGTTKATSSGATSIAFITTAAGMHGTKGAASSSIAFVSTAAGKHGTRAIGLSSLGMTSAAVGKHGATALGTSTLTMETAITAAHGVTGSGRSQIVFESQAHAAEVFKGVVVSSIVFTVQVRAFHAWPEFPTAERLAYVTAESRITSVPPESRIYGRAV